MTVRTAHAIPFLIGLALGALAASAWFLGETVFITTEPASETTASSTPLATPADKSGTLAVSNQPAGMTVVVDTETVPPPGVWVAVRDVNTDGTLGNILGAARAHGPVANFSIPLLRATVPGTQYAVILYRENGDGVFDPPEDSVYVDFDSGSRVVQYFTTTQ